MIHQIEGRNITYNITIVLLIEGDLEKERFVKSCRELVKRHESLRTKITIKGKLPLKGSPQSAL